MYSDSNSQIDELSTWKKSRSISMTERESAEAVWKELKEAVVECAEKHLQRRQPQRQCMAFSRHNGACKEEMPEVVQWQEQRVKCGVMARVSDLVQTSEESDKG